MAFLFRLRRKLRARGGRVALAGAKGNLRVVLRVVRLDRLVGLYSSVKTAAAALAGSMTNDSASVVDD
jgi:hypothetical protein